MSNTNASNKFGLRTFALSNFAVILLWEIAHVTANATGDVTADAELLTQLDVDGTWCMGESSF